MQLIGNDSDQELINWANNTINKEEYKISTLKDSSLKTGRYFIELCAAIEPRAVNWDLVTSGETDEDKMNNAKYAISIARKLGAIVFCVWEDIVKANAKMNLVFVCALNDAQKEMKSKKKSKSEEEKKEEA
eukprot:CAMPEP_0168352178 /NCGR_PEP_ID=MMETSP0213-20121227/22386_1 /TAXON_ID=151035 /ORGANISM="Euplotes harpa, Strain FSP1.4" /LENGTH=130 /DNA_ID=CAMNT_0008363319 /DNA_START=535 /DNA_END=923 /DNA_ORIENTATION=+